MIDYREPITVRFLLRESWIMDLLEDKLAAELNALSHTWHSAAAQNSTFDKPDENFRWHRERAAARYNDVGRAHLPWYKQWESGRVVRDIKVLRARMRDNEKNDPRLAAMLMRERRQVRKESTFAEAQAEQDAKMQSVVEALAAKKQVADQARKERKNRARRKKP